MCEILIGRVVPILVVKDVRIRIHRFIKPFTPKEKDPSDGDVIIFFGRYGVWLMVVVVTAVLWMREVGGKRTVVKIQSDQQLRGCHSLPPAQTNNSLMVQC